MSKYLDKDKLLNLLNEDRPTTQSSFHDGYRKCLDEIADDVEEGRFDDYSAEKERDEWRSNFDKLNRDGQAIQDHYKKVARGLWPGSDCPDIDTIAVRFNEMRKALEYIADPENSWENLPDYARKALGKEKPHEAP